MDTKGLVRALGEESLLRHVSYILGWRVLKWVSKCIVQSFNSWITGYVQQRVYEHQDVYSSGDVNSVCVSDVGLTESLCLRGLYMRVIFRCCLSTRRA